MDNLEIPGLGQALADGLGAAAQALGDEVRAVLLHSPRPVFLFYLAQTFDSVGAALASRRRPEPQTPAQQLCLHLIFARAEKHTPAPELARVRDELARHDSAVILAEVAAVAGIPRTSADTASYDFIALGDVLAAGGMSAFFEPFDSPGLVA